MNKKIKPRVENLGSCSPLRDERKVKPKTNYEIFGEIDLSDNAPQLQSSIDS